QHPIAVRILSGRTAERASQRRASAKPRHRDRGVGGATAIDDEKTLRLGFGVRLREAIDPEHLVEHDNARAQDRARVVTRASGTHLFLPSCPFFNRLDVQVSGTPQIYPQPANRVGLYRLTKKM